MVRIVVFGVLKRPSWRPAVIRRDGEVALAEQTKNAHKNQTSRLEPCDQARNFESARAKKIEKSGQWGIV